MKYIQIIALALVLTLVGCSSKNIGTLPPELRGAPNWVLNPRIEGSIASVGSAPRNAGNDFSFQRQEAMGSARDEMARQMSVKVGNMLKSFKSATGSGDDATFDRSTESVSKQIASQTLQGTRSINTWISQNGTMYMHVVLDTESVIEAMEQAVKTSYKNDKAIYQKFLAKKAQDELKEELEAFQNTN